MCCRRCKWGKAENRKETWRKSGWSRSCVQVFWLDWHSRNLRRPQELKEFVKFRYKRHQLFFYFQALWIVSHKAGWRLSPYPKWAISILFKHFGLLKELFLFASSNWFCRKLPLSLLRRAEGCSTSLLERKSRKLKRWDFTKRGWDRFFCSLF